MNRHKVLRDTLDVLQAGMTAQAGAWAEVSDAVAAMQLQIATLKQVVAEMNAAPKPDANGWIPRHTLR